MPATFVLVHGAWHGGWCFRPLEKILRAAGHEVFAPTLTGRGLPAARAQALAQILEDCDALRFVGTASGVDPAELAQRASKHASEMSREKLTPASES